MKQESPLKCQFSHLTNVRTNLEKCGAAEIYDISTQLSRGSITLGMK